MLRQPKKSCLPSDNVKAKHEQIKRHTKQCIVPSMAITKELCSIRNSDRYISPWHTPKSFLLFTNQLRSLKGVARVKQNILIWFMKLCMKHNMTRANALLFELQIDGCPSRLSLYNKSSHTLYSLPFQQWNKHNSEDMLLLERFK